MSITIDHITRKKLILVKQLYQQAFILSAAQHSHVGRIMALIGFDLATETVLKAVVAALEPTKSVDKDFQGLIQQADSALSKVGLNPVPDKINIQHVHSLRNDAQHKAKYPNETDIGDCRTYIRDFLQKIAFEVWELSLEALSLTDIIQHAKIKEFLVAAEIALSHEDYKEAIVKAEAGLSRTLELIKPSVVGQMDANANPYLNFVSLNRSQQSTYNLLEDIRNYIVRSAVGLNFPDYVRYKQIIHLTIDGMVFFQDGSYDVRLKESSPDGKDAEYAVTYATNAVVQIESLVGNIDAPFASSQEI